MLSAKIQEQISRFKRGFDFLELQTSASIKDGILLLSERQIETYISKYDEAEIEVEKFIPASGAATRMFQDLLTFRSTGRSSERLDYFFENLDLLPLEISSSDRSEILYKLLSEENLHNLPKGLLPFHRYENEIRNAATEHLYEGQQYALKGGGVKLHFTVSAGYEDEFKNQLEAKIEKLNTEFEISFSVQDAETDTIAVDLSNDPVLDKNGSIVMRPSGHGALLDNLNQRSADILFIKNVDNVVPDRLKSETTKFKKALAGLLLDYQKRVFDLLRDFDESSDSIHKGRTLLKELGWRNVSDEEIKTFLNRPIRVCGMVKNTGEPGGGPFWVEKDGRLSLQIVERVQIDFEDSGQKDIFLKSTHFNPTDLVCGIKNFRGEKFNLPDFRDDETGFITKKFYQGSPIKAMELPGLWNGSMAHWNTIFVEVPLITFNPVKTINDLLRPEHQN